MQIARRILRIVVLAALVLVAIGAAYFAIRGSSIPAPLPAPITACPPVQPADYVPCPAGPPVTERR